jgi:hypothetical protein
LGEVYILLTCICPLFILKKVDCYDSILALRGSDFWENSIVARDFNTTLNQAKKKGASIVKDPFRECMEDLITSWDLVDIKLIRGGIT